MSVTVVIASYKYGHLAAQAIESVLSQTVKPSRILFVDDGVGDCTHLPQLYPEVEYVLRENNLGTVANFQDMLMRVETEQTMFLGADNYLHPRTLEILSNSIADIVSYDINLVGDDVTGFASRVGATLEDSGYLVWRFHGGNIENGNYIHGSSLYNTAKAQAVGYAPSGGSRTEEDWVLFRGMLRNGATHEHKPEPLLYYRRHRTNFNPNS